MTTGFDLGLSSSQIDMKDTLHVAAREELRARAARTEVDGPDLTVLDRLLTQAGIRPATLLDGGVDDRHTVLIALEELAYGDASFAWAAVPALQIATVVGACGGGTQREAAAKILARDKARASVLLYEDYGRQPSEYETNVTTTDGRAVITGRKSSVAYPSGADVALLVAREGAELAAFLLTAPDGGGDVQPGKAEPGSLDFDRVAFTAVPSAPVRIEGLTVAAEARLGGERSLHRAVGQARLLLAACLIGIARASLEFASAYATQRTTWGRPIAEYQGVSFPLIEQTTELLEVRLLLWDVADRLGNLHDHAHIERHVARVLNRASSLALRATRTGVQHVGVRGISRDLPCERWYREAAVLAAVDFDILQTPFGLS